MLSTEKMKFPSIDVWNIQWWQLLPCKTDIQFLCDLAQGVYPEEVKTLIPRNLDVVVCSSFICKGKTGNIAAFWVNTYTNSCISTQQNMIQQWKETNYMWNNRTIISGVVLLELILSWGGTVSKSHIFIIPFIQYYQKWQKCEFITFFFSCQGWWGTNE